MICCFCNVWPACGMAPRKSPVQNPESIIQTPVQVIITTRAHGMSCDLSHDQCTNLARIYMYTSDADVLIIIPSIEMAMSRKPLSVRDNAHSQRAQSSKVAKKARYPFCLLNRSMLISTLKQNILKSSTSLSEDDLMRPTVSLINNGPYQDAHPKRRQS